MHRFLTKGIAVYQTAWIRGILRIRLNNLAVKNAKKHFIETQAIGLRLLIGMIRDAQPVITNGIDDFFNIHEYYVQINERPLRSFSTGLYHR